MSISVLKSAPARIVSCAPPGLCALLMCASLLVCVWPPAAVAQSVDRTVGQTPRPTPAPAPMPKELPRTKVAIPPPASDSVPGGGRPRRGILGPSTAPAQSTSRDVGQRATNLDADDRFTAEGRALAQQEQYDKAVVLYEQALEQHRAQHDRAGEARALNDLALAYYALSRYEKVIADSEQARAIMHELGDLAGEVAPLNMLGAAYHELGSYDQAIAYYKEALAIVRALYDTKSEAGALNNIGESLRLAGRCDEALKYINDAIALAEKPSTSGLGGLGGIGNIFGGVRRGLSAAGSQADGVTYDSLGATYYCLGQDTEAALAFTHALALYQRPAKPFAGSSPHTDLFDEGITRNNLGRVLLRQGQTDKALVELSRALVINREVKNQKAEAATLGNLMLVWQARGNPRLAAFYGKQAVNALQAIRSNIQQLDKSVQKGFLSAQQDTYRVLADLLISTGRLAEAQQIVGMLKEEEFFAFVRRDAGEVSALSARAALSPAEVELDRRYREIADRVAALGRERGSLRDKSQLTTEEEQRLTQLEADLEVAGQAFQKFLDGLAVELGNTAQTNDRVFQLRESQALMDTLRELGHGAVALYTVVGADKYRVILITPDVQKAAEYPIKEAELNRKVAAFREALQDPRRDPRPLAQELYKIIVGPIAQDLAEAHAETLMWSLDGTLRYVPLAALHDGDKYLVERFRNVVFTPASTSRLKDQPSAGWTALGLGVSKPHGDFPALPAVPAELHGIINDAPAQTDGVLPGRVMLDEAFTADALKTALRQRFPLVHIASHFQFAPGNETNSYLLLGDGTHLSLAQLKNATNLFSGVELLTLSACDTASGGAGADGREVESFGVLAQRQGAKSVLASLWPVADASTQQLMQNFYRLRNAQAGLPKAEALRQAQLALLHSTAASAPASAERGVKHEPGAASTDNTSYAHPYFWAPFILIGNWK
ncbi:MAG: CHAT domain-containing tetratricopeptide repeat protein [Pyrinomonadaceae bacterium]